VTAIAVADGLGSAVLHGSSEAQYWTATVGHGDIKVSISATLFGTATADHINAFKDGITGIVFAGSPLR
jgi:hypothetical protein